MVDVYPCPSFAWACHPKYKFLGFELKAGTKLTIKNNIKPDSQNQLPGFIRITDNVLLVFLVLLITARCQINESFHVEMNLPGSTSQTHIGGAEVTAMLTFAGLICTAAVIWLISRVTLGYFTWRKTALIGPAILMLIASVVSSTVASNKHTALIAVVNLLSCFLLAILLIQLMDKPWKQRLLLCAITATGVVMAYRCWEQKYHETPEMLQNFNENPARFLTDQGYEPGTYAAYQYADRIKSQDIGGFFAISNTAGSFFIMSITATFALLWNSIRQKRSTAGRITSETYALLLLGTLIILSQIVGLFITKSKGAIAAWIASLILLVVLWQSRNFLRRHWRSAIVAAIILIMPATIAVAAYGLHHGRLPSNSLWVRWQYWQASGKMIAEHWFTGVGAENFGQHYTRYMSPAAPEVVKDPHCLPIAIWSQWGLAGIAGFCWAILAVFIKLARPSNFIPAQPENKTSKHMSWITGLILIAGIIFIRRINSSFDIHPDELISVYIVSFIVPAAVWLIAFILIHSATSPDNTIEQQARSVVPVVLGCGLLGFLLHNSIDFAFFQPGVMCCFFAITALAIAAKQQDYPDSQRQLAKTAFSRILIIVTSLIILCAMWAKIIVPVATAQKNMKQAYQQNQSPTQSIHYAEKAADIDRLDPAGPYLVGRVYMALWQNAKPYNQKLFEKTITAFNNAIERDPANFRYYRQLSQLYKAACRRRPNNPELLDKTYYYAEKALDRYPSKSELLIDYARTSALLNKPEQALEAYRKTLKNEEAFLSQQKQMFPDRIKLVPRLKPDLRQQTESEIKRLKEP